MKVRGSDGSWFANLGQNADLIKQHSKSGNSDGWAGEDERDQGSEVTSHEGASHCRNRFGRLVFDATARRGSSNTIKQRWAFAYDRLENSGKPTPTERLVHRREIRYRQRVSRCETQSNINHTSQCGRTVENGTVRRNRRSAASRIRRYVSAPGDGAGGLQIVGQLVRLSTKFDS
jgi:hypothetical protein